VIIGGKNEEIMTLISSLVFVLVTGLVVTIGVMLGMSAGNKRPSDAYVLIHSCTIPTANKRLKVLYGQAFKMGVDGHQV